MTRRRPNARVLRRLLSYGAPHTGLLLGAFACMAVLGLTTGLYAYLMGPALRFLLSGGVEGLGVLGPTVQALPRERLLVLLPLVLAGIGVFKGVAYLGQFYLVGLYGQRVSLAVRRDVFRKLCALSPVQLSRKLSGDLLSRLSADVEAVEVAATYAVASYLRDGLQLVILGGVALWLDWRVALGTLLVVPVAVLPIARVTRQVLARTREAQARLGTLAGQVQEGLGGLRTLQAYNAQAAELLRFQGHADAHARAVTRAGWARGLVPAMMEVLAAAAIAVALGFALGRQWERPEVLVSVLTALVLAYQPLKELGRVGQFVLQAQTAGERLFELLDDAHPVPEPTAPAPLDRVLEEVRLEDVHFDYGGRPALQGLTLSLPVGQVTALVGPSGSGKSTVASLLLRFERPRRGRLLLDGRDASTLASADVRRQFALVTQEPLLFSESVEENLRYGRPEATREQLEAAAKAALADGFVAALPEGAATRIGERGVRLSGGQRQRLCLARALLTQAPVLVLDEATSSLDPESEREVQAALERLLPGRTALVIAHRLRTVVGAHRIHVLEAGRVVESGTHGELLARGGLYARLWGLQEGETEGRTATG